MCKITFGQPWKLDKFATAVSQSAQRLVSANSIRQDGKLQRNLQEYRGAAEEDEKEEGACK
jgi:hypothetical protein